MSLPTELDNILILIVTLVLFLEGVEDMTTYAALLFILRLSHTQEDPPADTPIPHTFLRWCGYRCRRRF